MKKNREFIIPLVVVLNLFLLFSLLPQYVHVANGSNNFNQDMTIIGIVNNGSFIEAETKQHKNLTDVYMQEARSLESGQINLTQYEGKALLVFTPQPSEGEWIYAANITDIGTPITTQIVKKIYNYTFG
jgi:hypothetical protein